MLIIKLPPPPSIDLTPVCHPRQPSFSAGSSKGAGASVHPHRPILHSIRPPNAPLQRRLPNPCIQADRVHPPHQSGDKFQIRGLGILHRQC
ncbi:hypothetical protein FA13DRAFT_284175 [Coprinellus micaceus]|uniref:Uncharacterized protein n=1 Tax=Coprinellus micaceus TaxID=71717 RepID=A0A4Y7TDQ8_COPMI|nr:hypothetical protein FA13DRAFT_284175 [Coprinellus micaceus]